MSNHTPSPVLLGWLFGAYASLHTDEAPGQTPLFGREGLSVRGTLEAALGAFPTIHTAFGRGRVDARSGDNTGDARWGEAYLKSGLELSLGPARFGTLNAGVTGLATVTVGDGDAAGFTRGGDGGVDRERLYLGWRSGNLWERLWLLEPGGDRRGLSLVRWTDISMNDENITQIPGILDAIWQDTEKLGFTMASEPKTGSLLRALAASKPGGRFLELGTGTGVGTAWLLAGMDADSRLESVESDATVLQVAQRHLGHDPRVRFHRMDGAEFLAESQQQFDLVYADTWPGKFTHLDLALSLVRIGGIYFIDDLLPQPNWPEGHAPKVPALIAELESRNGFACTKLAWASGHMVLVRTDAT